MLPDGVFRQSKSWKNSNICAKTMSMKLPLLIAISALMISGSAALRIPSPPSHLFPLDLVNDTNTSLQAPGHFPNLTFTPWPAPPFEIELHSHTGDFELIVGVTNTFDGRRPFSVPRLQAFVREFSDNIEREYPIPSYVPRRAKQHHIDLDSYTKWNINIDQGFFDYRLPTEWALVALNELARQLGVHGPGDIVFNFSEGDKSYGWGYLIISDFGRRSVDASLTREGSIFQTS